jgi:hypothetical protein
VAPLTHAHPRHPSPRAPAATEGSPQCGDVLNDQLFTPAAGDTAVQGAGKKIRDVLPANWWVFGQALLQQVYLVCDRTGFSGQGAIHMARLPAAPGGERPAGGSAAAGGRGRTGLGRRGGGAARRRRADRAAAAAQPGWPTLP